MAVDTRNKRASVLGLALASLVVLPAPDATIGAPDRAQTAYCYAGLFSDGISGSAIVTTPAPTVSGTGRLVVTGTGAVTTPAPTVAATGHADVASITGTGAVTTPAPTVDAWGVTGDLVRVRPFACGVASPSVTGHDSASPRVTGAGGEAP